ncbi:hypothetical protein JCM21714_4787 [Gracilibacillus boraciitolerans JCM 21714]|uniref:DUF5085 domain-containing protein n=1 Tax=Gracilibacillus boraciitolerans JCM 21714 TaxID=1298598 RepID=W4VR20_9BACI|nr:hypothetical protein [Gracilibacillus boraciitolerans]GAE95509.1 hypothetical protein JCM21714_4787 [Gracilibacillus boraciitolerans JCM 21714]
MKIEKRAIQFDHLLVHETTQLREQWQDGVYVLEDLIITEGIYQNGPIFFSVSPTKNEEKYGDFTYYMPINGAVSLENETDFHFVRDFFVEEALVMRQADQEIDFYAAKEKLEDYAAESNIKLDDTFYMVLLEVYGDIIIDLYIPVQNRGDLT